MITLSTHALDTTLGRPAVGLGLYLESWDASQWHRLAQGVTNHDGRCPDLWPSETVLEPGIYRMSFETEAYFAAQSMRGFYPLVQVIFEIQDEGHYHIPLLLSPYGYSTYRGS